MWYLGCPFPGFISPLTVMLNLMQLFFSACHFTMMEYLIFSCVCQSGVFKHPQHMAWETWGEMEPTDLKLFTGKRRISHNTVTSMKYSNICVHFINCTFVFYYLVVLEITAYKKNVIFVQRIFFIFLFFSLSTSIKKNLITCSLVKLLSMEVTCCLFNCLSTTNKQEPFWNRALLFE